MARNYFKVKDIYSLVDDKRRVRVYGDGKLAIVNYCDGARWYRRKDVGSDWELYNEKIFTNF